MVLICMQALHVYAPKCFECWIVLKLPVSAQQPSTTKKGVLAYVICYKKLQKHQKVIADQILAFLPNENVSRHGLGSQTMKGVFYVILPP